MYRNSGFTLIELMIVVAIIAILTALAMPAYQDFVIRSQVAEGASLVGSAKIAVTEYYLQHGTPPGSNGAAHLPPATEIQGKYVTRIDVSAGGVLTATFGNRANQALIAQTLAWQPGFGVGSTTWTCDSGGLDPRWLPASCR